MIMNDKDEIDYKESYNQLKEIYSRLNEKYQDACITINELNTTIKTLMRMYVRHEEIANAFRNKDC